MVHGWRTTTRINHMRHDLQGQRSKSQGHVINLSRLGAMLYLSLAAGGGMPCRPNPTATLLVSFTSVVATATDVRWLWRRKMIESGFARRRRVGGKMVVLLRCRWMSRSQPHQNSSRPCVIEQINCCNFFHHELPPDK